MWGGKKEVTGEDTLPTPPRKVSVGAYKYCVQPVKCQLMELENRLCFQAIERTIVLISRIVFEPLRDMNILA